MIILKSAIGLLIFLMVSVWLIILIAVGVIMGLKNYFDESSKGGR